MFDADGSGAIDPEEFAALCRQLDPSMTQEMIDEAINKIDEDVRCVFMKLIFLRPTVTD
eukprot:SAG31_NODE_21_length_34109_cov_60.598824_9_plen_59_part_00